MERPSIVSFYAIDAILEKKGLYLADPNIKEEIYKKFYNNFQLILTTAQELAKHQHEKKITIDCLNEAFTLHNLKPLLGYKPNKTVKYETVDISNGQKLEVPVDNQIDLAKLVKEPLKPYPIESYFSFHWLAVLRGVQPRIPENAKYVFFIRKKA